jgi:hypothetical protein
MIPDFCGYIETSLDKRLGANKHPVPDLECFQVPKVDSAADSHPVAKLSGKRSRDCPAHQAIQLAIANRKPSVLFQQNGGRVAFAEVL